MTYRTHFICTLCAMALTYGCFASVIAGTTAINAQLALMACRRTPDALCAHF